MIEVLDDELSLENGFKSSLSKIKKHGHRHSNSQQLIKKKPTDDDMVDLGDLGSPTSSRSFDIQSSASSSTIGTAITTGIELNHTRHSSVTNDDIILPGESEINDTNPNHLFDAEGFAEKMKTAAILLAQLQLDHPQQDTTTTIKASTEGIRQKIIAEMMALEDDRMEKMAMEGVDSGIGGGGGEGAGNEKQLDDESRVAMVVNKEDPSGKLKNKYAYHVWYSSFFNFIL